MAIRLAAVLIIAASLFLTGCGDDNDDADLADQAGAVATHAVLVHLASLDDTTGLFELEDQLIEAIDQASAGEFDGNEVGPEGATLYMYGPDADQLWSAVEPVLQRTDLGEGAFAVRRYGEPGVREERVDL